MKLDSFIETRSEFTVIVPNDEIKNLIYSYVRSTMAARAISPDASVQERSIIAEFLAADESEYYMEHICPQDDDFGVSVSVEKSEASDDSFEVSS